MDDDVHERVEEIKKAEVARERSTWAANAQQQDDDGVRVRDAHGNVLVDTAEKHAPAEPTDPKTGEPLYIHMKYQAWKNNRRHQRHLDRAPRPAMT